jgi:hypothetical protein
MLLLGLMLGWLAYALFAVPHLVPTYGESGADLTLAVFLLGGVVAVLLIDQAWRGQ